MAKTIYDFYTNKNAVIIHYPYLYPYRPAYDVEKPTGCVVRFHGYLISTSIYEKCFRVGSNAEKFSKHFSALREASNFVINRVNNRRTLFR